jgi:hypothetical protein
MFPFAFRVLSQVGFFVALAVAEMREIWVTEARLSLTLVSCSEGGGSAVVNSGMWGIGQCSRSKITDLLKQVVSGGEELAIVQLVEERCVGPQSYATASF